jgi:hypothetical protein
MGKIPIYFGLLEDSIESQINKHRFTLGRYESTIESKRNQIHEDYLENKINDKKKNRLYLNLYDEIVQIMVKVNQNNDK